MYRGQNKPGYQDGLINPPTSQSEGVRPNGTIDPEWARNNPDAAQAALMEEQWNLFTERYRPLENSVLAQYMAKSRRRLRSGVGGWMPPAT